MSLFLLLAIIISLIIKVEISKATAISSVGLGLILLVPILDWLISGGYLITYPLRLKPFIINFLNPFESITYLGVSPGQRITIILISVLVTFYSYLKKKNWLVSISLFFITLIIILFWGALPTIMAGNRPENVYLPGGTLDSDTKKFAAIFALLFLFSLFVYYSRLNKNYFKILIKSLRFERMLFYSGIGLFGFIIGMHQKGIILKADFFDIIGIILLVSSLALGFQAAQVINDFFDIESDRVSRKRNPLLNDMNKNYYLIWGFCLIILALVFTLIINYSCFLLMFSYLLLSVIYSVPPVRLKRIPVISTFILAAAVILAMAMGYSLLFGNHALNAIPKTILMPTMLGITFGFIAKDIQDFNSDRGTGVITLPSILYKDSFIGRLPVAILVGISYLFYIIFIPRVLIGAIIFSALTIIYTIFIKKPKEWLYFIMLYLFGFYLLLVLLKE